MNVCKNGKSDSQIYNKNYVLPKKNISQTKKNEHDKSYGVQSISIAKKEKSMADLRLKVLQIVETIDNSYIIYLNGYKPQRLPSKNKGVAASCNGYVFQVNTCT